MLKKLCATKIVFGNGYTAGSYDATTRSQFNERDRKWIPRSYFDGGTSANGYTPSRPWTIRLQYNAQQPSQMSAPNTIDKRYAKVRALILSPFIIFAVIAVCYMNALMMDVPMSSTNVIYSDHGPGRGDHNTCRLSGLNRKRSFRKMCQNSKDRSEKC